MENKFLVATVFWKRYDLFKMFVRHHQRMGLDILVIGSEGEKSKKFCEDLGCIYIEHPNQPLALKFNRRIKFFMEQDEYSHLILLGSDDFIDDVVLEKIKELSNTYDVISWTDIYYHNLKNGNSMYSNGYKGTQRQGEPLAPGRCISKKVVKELDGKLWTVNGPSTPDANVWRKLKKVKNKINLSCKKIGGIIVDVKTDINQHSYSLINSINKHKKLKIDNQIDKKIKNIMVNSKKEYVTGESVIVSPKAKIGKNVTIGNFVVIEDDVEIGENTTIKNFVEIRKNTKIGKNCYIDSRVSTSGNCVVGDDVTLRYDVILARGCEVGNNTYICPRVMTNNLDTGGEQIGGAHIGNGCFVGTNTVFQHGVKMGDNSITGAMSFINKDIPQNEIWVGSPAKLLKIKNT